MISPIGDLETLGLTPPRASDADEPGRLGQEEFLRLMIAQLENQDPTKPLESGEFLGQLAQFGTVSGLGDLKTSFEGLARSLVSNQALQAAGLVGRSVLARSGEAYLPPGGGATGAVELPVSSADVRVQLLDAGGQLVKEVNLGPQPAGLVRFSWAGDNDAGAAMPSGRYRIVAQYLDDGKMQTGESLIDGTVESVRLGPDGLGIQLRGLGEFSFDAIQEIG